MSTHRVVVYVPDVGTATQEDIECSDLAFDPRDDKEGNMGCTFSELLEDFEEEFNASVTHTCDAEDDHEIVQECIVTPHLELPRDAHEEMIENLCLRISQYMRGDTT